MDNESNETGCGKHDCIQQPPSKESDGKNVESPPDALIPKATPCPRRKVLSHIRIAREEEESRQKKQKTESKEEEENRKKQEDQEARDVADCIMDLHENQPTSWREFGDFIEHHLPLPERSRYFNRKIGVGNQTLEQMNLLGMQFPYQKDQTRTNRDTSFADFYH